MSRTASPAAMHLLSCSALYVPSRRVPYGNVLVLLLVSYPQCGSCEYRSRKNQHRSRDRKVTGTLQVRMESEAAALRCHTAGPRSLQGQVECTSAHSTRDRAPL